MKKTNTTLEEKKQFIENFQNDYKNDIYEHKQKNSTLKNFILFEGEIEFIFNFSKDFSSITFRIGTPLATIFNFLDTLRNNYSFVFDTIDWHEYQVENGVCIKTYYGEEALDYEKTLFIEEWNKLKNIISEGELALDDILEKLDPKNMTSC